LASPEDVTAAPKTNDTLVQDIYDVFDKDIEVNPEDVKAFGGGLARIVHERVTERYKPRLRLSNLGKPCRRQLWYSINTPELAEKLQGWTRIKFLIGDITEAVILFLAKLSGHSVTHEQHEVEINGVRGHIDALVNGELVDVKSASAFSFAKFTAGLKPEQDAFGYLSQLGSYGAALGHKRAHFLPVDKVLGHIHLDTHELPEVDYAKVVDETNAMLAKNEPPPRSFDDVKDGESGNRKLGTNCSYCDFKHTCWPGLQVYGYSNGPRFLTKVVRAPKVDRV
jgi:hypothetical protein